MYYYKIILLILSLATGTFSYAQQTTTYQYYVGELVFENKQLYMMKMLDKGIYSYELAVRNSSTDTISLTNNFIAPDYINMHFADSLLYPEQESKLIFTYDAEAKNDWGYFKEVLFWKRDSTYVDWLLHATVLPAINKDTLPLDENPPALAVEKNYIDLGTFWEGDSISHVLNLHNKGDKELRIFKILPNCDCMLLDQQSLIIPASQDRELNIQIKTEGRRGPMTNILSIFTNDPVQPVHVLSFKTYIKIKND